MAEERKKHLKKPDWLKIRLPGGKNFTRVKEIVEGNHLHTICSSGNCPNMGECWNAGTATFMILGDICTRSCRFCATKTGRPFSADPLEPRRVAESIRLMKLKHCVITSVDRDDLPDGGAAHWAETIRQVRTINPGVTIEVLIPDFSGNLKDVDKVIAEKPDIISHNLETVRRLTPLIRSAARYDRSLEVLKHIADSKTAAKSGIMAGIGETGAEVLETMDDLLSAGVSIMTIGQYLQPTRAHLPVEEYITPEIFEKYRIAGIEKGFRHIESRPLVRSSYHAEKHVL
ncbi:lipoyl synthase [Lentimicrobium sp.]|jgi:lipoic acid synthetase|uniref:lipoyl synthase n=1 Tax=Lentimicrobium sp. TaxID=2034841 RepID=UPI0025E3C9D2|nr:lipoyl synthase [Lentimicrobium sp.]MCO5255822.1 lipoyl synthase [Lentimicrobium sp.]HOP14125.1 lipoyl synthase [Lentimicrobium sp.]HPF63633.1 lipoyl synthase [Lentimicrobium sp.]HPJ63239.1 lipoyl synthase [Lentimicrobium sp.]HPR26155.1 lipoyl synthase [Lentimicrobium sp.]